MSRSYQQYIDEVIDEIERVMEIRRKRPIQRRVSTQSFWGAPAPASAPSTSSAGPPSSTPKDGSSNTKDFKINVRAEVHRINSQIEALSPKSIPETKPNSDEKLAKDSIEIIPIDSNSEFDKVAVYPRCDNFTIGGAGDSDYQEDLEQKAPSDIVAAEEFEMHLKESNDEGHGGERAQAATVFVFYGFLIVFGILAIAIFAACIYDVVMQSY